MEMSIPFHFHDEDSLFILFSSMIDAITMGFNNIQYVRKIKRTCAYQGVRNVNFSENFANLRNKKSLSGTQSKEKSFD